MQHHKQPEESQDHQLVEKLLWNHSKVPSLSHETGRFYPMLGPIELSAAERYTTGHAILGQHVVVGSMLVLQGALGNVPRGVWLDPRLYHKATSPRLAVELSVNAGARITPVNRRGRRPLGGQTSGES